MQWRFEAEFAQFQRMGGFQDIFPTTTVDEIFNYSPTGSVMNAKVRLHYGSF